PRVYGKTLTHLGPVDNSARLAASFVSAGSDHRAALVPFLNDPFFLEQMRAVRSGVAYFGEPGQITHVNMTEEGCLEEPDCYNCLRRHDHRRLWPGSRRGGPLLHRRVQLMRGVLQR